MVSGLCKVLDLKIYVANLRVILSVWIFRDIPSVGLLWVSHMPK